MLSGINQASQMANLLFTKLDTRSQGYIEKSDLTSAFSQIAENTKSSSTSVDEVFTTLDGDSDGKVTKDEFASVLAKLQEQLSSQLSHGRMHGAGGSPQGMGGMPPPPADDAGFTAEELSSQLASADSSDTERTNLISNIVSNFEAADSDGDGKVSFKEAMAYDQSTKTASSTTSDGTTSTSSANSSNAQVMMKIMQLVHAYSSDSTKDGGIASLLSVSA